MLLNSFLVLGKRGMPFCAFLKYLENAVENSFFCCYNIEASGNFLVICPYDEDGSSLYKFMKKRILLNYPFCGDNLYIETYCKALKNIAIKHNFFYEEYPIWDLEFKLTKFEGFTVYIIPFHRRHTLKQFEDVKNYFGSNENSKIVVLGSDLIYEPENAIKWNPDLLIEATIANKLQTQCNFPVESIYWNISKQIIQEIKNKKLIFSPENKKYDLISLCRCDSLKKKRYELFERLKNKFSFLYNLGNWNFNEVCELYNKSWFVIGTTTCAIGIHNIRTMKGMRDSMAPFCGTLLLSDDYPDMIEQLNDSEMIYKNYDNLIKKIDLYKNNPNKYKEKIEKQKVIFEKYNMDDQLENLFSKYRLL